MTESRSTDPRIRAWLDLMPAEAPERVLEAVLQAVETVPQARRPFRLAMRRNLQMNRLSLAATGAIALIVLASGAYLLTRSTTPPVGATPQPTVAATSSPGVGQALPTNLVGLWFGPHTPVVGDPSRSGTALRLDTHSVLMTPPNSPRTPVLRGDASVAGADLVVTTGAGTASGCEAGDAGSYPFAVSDTGLTLTISAGTDPCNVRAASLVGTWSRSACADSQDNCLGPLDAGVHASQSFASFLAHGVTWTPSFGGLTYTVPAGWTNDEDWPSAYDLTPTADAQATPSGGDPARSIEVLSNVMPESQATPCSGQVDATVKPGVNGFLDWLATVPGIQLGRRTSQTIGVHTATAVDVQMPSAPKALCNGTDPVVEYLLANGWSNGSGGSTDHHFHGITPGAEERLILMDGGAGDLIAILVQVSDAKDFQAFLAGAQPILSSFRLPNSFPGG